MALTDNQISIAVQIMTTWRGFHATRRRVGLYISHCYLLLACVWLEYAGKTITAHSVRMTLAMYKIRDIHYYMSFLKDKGFIVLSREERDRKYYDLTDSGRAVAAELLEGIEAKQSAFFTQYLS